MMPVHQLKRLVQKKRRVLGWRLTRLPAVPADERAKLERKLVRKIDLRILPMIILMYILNYLDRNNIASARVQGLQADLQLSDVQYQYIEPPERLIVQILKHIRTAVSILFVGYLLMQGGS